MDDAARRPDTVQSWGSGRRERAPEPRFLAIGQVVGVHGIHGELKVAVLTDDPARFGLLERVYVGREGEEPRPRRLERYRLHQGRVLLTLEGLGDRDAAAELRGFLVQIPLAEALPLGEGEYYEHQIIGLAVWTSSGEPLGEVIEILYTGANDVYVVQGPQRQILIPAIKEVIRDVDLEGGRLIVQLLEGLL